MTAVNNRLQELQKLREQSRLGGGAKRVEQQHQRGKLTARERIDLLLDEGSFEELDPFVTHRATDFGVAEQRYLSDAVVTGHGHIDGRVVCVYSQDFTVFGGSLSEVVAEKIVKLQDMAMKIGAPIIGLNDSGGARIQEGVDSLAGYGDIFLRNTLASGVIPQISVIMGPSAGGAVYSPAITDFIFMVEGTGQMYITGPDVIKSVTGEDVTHEELGGALAHAAKSGVAHFALDGDEQCLQEVRRLMSFLPSSNMDDPPTLSPTDDPNRREEALGDSVPDDPGKPYDMKEILHAVVDHQDFLEVHRLFAPNIIVGFARLDGRPVGIVAQAAGIPGRRPGHRCVGEGGPVCPVLRRLQRAAGHVHGRARVHARHCPGVWGYHPARGQAALRLFGGDGAQGQRHHPKGLRWRLLGHGQ